MWVVYCGCPGNPQRCSCLLRVLIIGPPFILYAVVSPHHDPQVWLPNAFKAFQILSFGAKGYWGAMEVLDKETCFIILTRNIWREW